MSVPHEPIPDEATPMLENGSKDNEEATSSSESLVARWFINTKRFSKFKTCVLAVMVVGCGLFAMTQISSRSQVETMPSSSLDVVGGKEEDRELARCYREGSPCDDIGFQENFPSCHYCCNPSSVLIHDTPHCGHCANGQCGSSDWDEGASGCSKCCSGNYFNRPGLIWGNDYWCINKCYDDGTECSNDSTYCPSEATEFHHSYISKILGIPCCFNCCNGYSSQMGGRRPYCGQCINGQCGSSDEDYGDAYCHQCCSGSYYNVPGSLWGNTYYCTGNEPISLSGPSLF